MKKYKINRKEIVREMENVLDCKGGVEHKVAPFLLKGWIKDLLATKKPESDKYNSVNVPSLPHEPVHTTDSDKESKFESDRYYLSGVIDYLLGGVGKNDKFFYNGLTRLRRLLLSPKPESDKESKCECDCHERNDGYWCCLCKES